MEGGNARVGIRLARVFRGFKNSTFTVISQSEGPALTVFPLLIHLTDPNVASKPRNILQVPFHCRCSPYGLLDTRLFLSHP